MRRAARMKDRSLFPSDEDPPSMSEDDKEGFVRAFCPDLVCRICGEMTKRMSEWVVFGTTWQDLMCIYCKTGRGRRKNQYSPRKFDRQAMIKTLTTRRLVESMVKSSTRYRLDGGVFRKLREICGYSKKDLAFILGVSRMFISRQESTLAPMIDEATLFKIIETLELVGVKVDKTNFNIISFDEVRKDDSF
jgi:DNA-binding XRE family transcriptional regulator